MNEIRPTTATPVNPSVASAVSSAVLDEAHSLPQGGNKLPAQDKVELIKEASNVDIEKAVTEINEYVQSVQRDLHFSVDEESGLTVIRVRDQESGELIRQIPEDIFLSLAQNLKDNQAINLFDAHG